MIMSSRVLPEFELLTPQSLPEALEMLQTYGEKALIMAGGTDLLVEMKKNNAPKDDIVILSLAEIPGLDFVQNDSVDGLRIGAMATLAQMEHATGVKERYTALWSSALTNGTPQTRNMGTVVGNVLRGSPAGDCCCAILAHGGSVVLENPAGRREVSIDEFWLDYRVTARKPNEIAVEIKLPPPPAGTVSAFASIARTSQDCSQLNFAVSLTLEGKICKSARLAIGAVGATLLRLKEAEAMISGVEITEALLEKVVGTVPAQICPIDDCRSTAAYRSEVAGIVAKRTIREALGWL
jgi:CO/xanthine dehydrogenase FAD-binding subunit